MNSIRRSLLAALGVLLRKPLAALAAWNEEAFGAKTAADALKSLGAASPAPSKDIVIEAPQIAENGAVVPIEISSNIPGTNSIAVLIEKNPFPLAASSTSWTARCRSSSSTSRWARPRTCACSPRPAASHYAATRKIKVTIGGCGG